MNQAPLPLLAAKARLLAYQMVYRAQSGHIGGSLSAMDVRALLYGEVLRVDPKNPYDPQRDRFALSKGHCTPALYATLALRGFFPMQYLVCFRQLHCYHSGHPEMGFVPGVDMSTGSLGQGISMAVGMSLAGKMDGAGYRVYALLGDGELDEGQVWEAAMAAAKFKLDNLCAIVDVNGLQIDGKTDDVMPTEPIDEKFAAFGWNVLKADGHDFDQLRAAFQTALAAKDKPTVLLMRTVKGKGVSYMENDPQWHGKAPGEELFLQGEQELKAKIAELEGK